MMKKCFVPSCENNSENSADKIFIFVPKNRDKRVKWFEAVNNPVMHLQVQYYCCEDHFILENDAENWQQFKLLGTTIRMKPDVVPHRFIQTPPKEKLPSQLTNSAKKRKSENVMALVKPQLSVKRKLFPIPEASTSRKTDAMCTSPSGKFSVSVIEPVYQCPTLQEKSVQVVMRPKIRSVAVGIKVRVKDRATSPVFKTHIKSRSSTAEIQSIPSVSSVQSPQSTSSSVSAPSSGTVFSKDSKDLHLEGVVINKHRKETTLNVIENNSRFYLGLRKEVYILVKFVSAKKSVHYVDILITLKKIRLGDVYTRLALDFGMSTSNVQRIFTRSVPLVADILQSFIFWPPLQSVQRLLPIPFRLRYSKVVSIIDCFEIQIEKPTNAVIQSKTWSEYKKCNTLKYLVSCTPNGFINFVSRGFGGRTTDNCIVENSTFLNGLPLGSSVMADRGFKQIDVLLATRNCVLIRPPSVGANQQSSAKEVKQSKQIAALRIHIERIISRIREFEMLQPHKCIDHQLLYLMDCIVIIACAIVNLQGPLIK